MSRFADTRSTTRIPLGPCECPGAPHDEDYALVRSELSATEIARFAMSDASTVAIVAADFVTEWNLVGANGQPWPPSPESLLALKTGSITPIVAAISAACRASSLPNTSAAPSAGSSLASGSPTPN